MDKVLTVIYLRDILTRPFCPDFKFQPHLQKVLFPSGSEMSILFIYIHEIARSVPNKVSVNFNQEHVKIILS